jgi:hypothetical protein
VLRSEERAAARLPGEALRIAVAVRIDRRVGKGIVCRHTALRRQPEDLAGRGREILGQFGLEGLAHRDMEHAVGTERDAPAIVKGPAGESIEDNTVEVAVVALVAQTNDTVPDPVEPFICLHRIDVR